MSGSVTRFILMQNMLEMLIILLICQFKPLDHARADWASWTCSTCGNKGHHQNTCTNPPNPKAAKMVLLAKEEAAAKHKERLHLKSKRKRIQEANEL